MHHLEFSIVPLLFAAMTLLSVTGQGIAQVASVSLLAPQPTRNGSIPMVAASPNLPLAPSLGKIDWETVAAATALSAQESAAENAFASDHIPYSSNNTSVLDPHAYADPHNVMVETMEAEARLAWWMQPVANPLRHAEGTVPADVTGLLSLAAQFSGRVLAVQQEPWIRGEQLVQAKAGFDPKIYAGTRFDSTSDPVGNTLTTGGPPRLEQNIWGMDAGLRGQSTSGASYDIGQRLGYTNSNSLFFIPNDQGSSRMAATVTQPLLRGRAIDFNRSLVLTATFETEAAQAEYLSTIQKQLEAVARAYWSLYTERATLVQRAQHLQRARRIAELIEERKSYDAIESQVLRARAAVATREAELARAEANIRNAESLLRSLINAPGISDQPSSEIVTAQPPLLDPVVFDPETEVSHAMQRRPDLQQLHAKRRVAAVQLQLATDQTQAKLNLVMEGYVAGLEGDSDVFGAAGNQFSEGRPGYASGLEFELPYRNRAARAKVGQNRLELIQLENLIREAEGNIQAEVETAIRNADAARRAAIGRRASTAAVIAEVEYLHDRWESLQGDARLGQLQLSDLLEAQVRLFQEEQTLLSAMVEYNLAIVDVQRATGALVRFAY